MLPKVLRSLITDRDKSLIDRFRTPHSYTSGWCLRRRTTPFIADVHFFLKIGRRHSDGAVAQLVVNVHQILDHIYLANGAAVRQICPYPSLDSSVESLYHINLLIVLTGKVLDFVTLY